MLFFSRPPRTRVLILCTANLCRSPMAAALLRARAADRHRGLRVAVRSRGTAVAAPGRPADPRVRAILRESGIPPGRSRARQVAAADLAWADRILVMERRHRDAVEQMAPAVKVDLFTAFLPEADSEDIPDPYFANRQALEACLAQLDAAVSAFLGTLQPGAGPVSGR
ncbi:MAG: arsenate reductase/protein-tyrosine-phosphatase family protein [Pseudohaliea sp.]